MANWSDQLSGLQLQWVEQQQELLNNWLKTLNKVGSVSSPTPWQQAIDILEKQVNSTLDAQKQSLMTLAENSEEAEGVPEQMVPWFQQIEEGIDLWNDMQHQLWRVWFDMLRTAPPVDEQPGETLLKNWQEFTNKAMEIQEQWLSNWENVQSEAGKSAGKKSSEPTSGTRSGAED